GGLCLSRDRVHRSLRWRIDLRRLVVPATGQPQWPSPVAADQLGQFLQADRFPFAARSRQCRAAAANRNSIWTRAEHPEVSDQPCRYDRVRRNRLINRPPQVRLQASLGGLALPPPASSKSKTGAPRNRLIANVHPNAATRRRE